MLDVRCLYDYADFQGTCDDSVSTMMWTETIMALGGTKSFHVTIPSGEESKRQSSPSLYRRWNRFSSLQVLLEIWFTW